MIQLFIKPWGVGQVCASFFNRNYTYRCPTQRQYLKHEHHTLLPLGVVVTLLLFV